MSQEQSQAVNLDSKEEEFKAFIEFHGPQLNAMGFPKDIQRRLFSKLKFQDFDAGEYVQIIMDEDNEQMYLRSLKDMKAGADVFLIDHAWTFKQRSAFESLSKNEKLRQRLDNLMKFNSKKDLPLNENPYKKEKPSLQEYLDECEKSTDPVLSYVLDEYEIESLKDFKFREEVEEISLWSNKIFDPNDVTQILMKLPNLKALWLNDNPVSNQCSNFEVIGNHFEKLEIINSQLTAKAGEWAILFYARDQGVKSLDQIESLNLSGKNLLALDDLSFLKKMTNLKRLDISDSIQMYLTSEMLLAQAKKQAEGSGQTSYDFVENKQHRDELLKNIPSLEHLICDLVLEVYILDTREQKKFLPNLKTINKVPIEVIDIGERTKQKKILEQMRNIWKYVNSYRLVKPGVMDEEPTFYINDEVGTSISHSDDPNVKLAPFIYSPNCEVSDLQTTTYTLLWLLKDITKQNYLYRDYLNGVTESEWRSAKFFTWFNVPEEYFEQEYQKFLKYEPPFDAIQIHQELQLEYPSPSQIDWDVQTQGPIPVYTDYVRVVENLKDPRFRIVDNPKEAKILWLTKDYVHKTFLEWEIDEKNTYVNFFKKESALVAKHHLANMINTTLKNKSCIQQTFDLQNALPVFIGAFLDREKKSLENTWIVKPTNMARSIDTWVTNNCEQICRLVETGPKIAQKYIDRPLTFQGRKIDLRYVVLLKSVLPLQLYVYNEFFIRFSNNQFTMAETTFHEYETHFTVMNYGKQITNIRCLPFIEMFNEEYSQRGIKFEDLNLKIRNTIAEVFIAFQTRYGKEIESFGNIDKQRAIYGVDVMIDQDLQPKLLEVTFAPDMDRFCKFTPDGWDHIFQNLFFNEDHNLTQII